MPTATRPPLVEHDETTTDQPTVETGVRRQLTPWVAMGCLVLAAAAARAAVHATGDQQDTVVITAIVAFATAVVVSIATRGRRMGRRLRHRYLAAMYLSATWLTHVTASGLTWGPIATLAIIGAGLSLLYWREHRIDSTTPARTTDAPALDATEDMFIDRWAANLAAPGKPYPGSRLATPQIIKAGYRYVLHLVPGTQTVSAVTANPAGLRGGLQLLPGQDVIVEEHPTLPAPTALVTIVTRPQVTKPQPWPGPEASFDSARGGPRVGPFVDGEGTAVLSIYRQNGMFGGYFQGGNGSGKSRLIDSVGMSCAASSSHPTIIWYADGQKGASSPLLAEHADYKALTPEAFHEMLTAAVRVMDINGVENRVNHVTGFTPTAARPGLLVIVDEQHVFFDPNENPLLAAACQQMATLIARAGRKAGVALLGASQSPTLDAFGGAGNGADTFRSCLLQGAGVILRSMTGNVKMVFKVDINPSSFPQLPGYAYLCNPEPGARNAPFRGYWVTDRMAATWPAHIMWRTLPARQANAAGPAYMRRRETAAQQTAADLAMLARADAGLLDVVDEPAAAGGATVHHFGDAFPPVRRVERFWLTTAPAARHAPTHHAPAHGQELHEGQRRVLDAIRHGHASPKELMAETNYSQSQIYNLLADLARMRMIVKTGYGLYEATIAA